MKPLRARHGAEYHIQQELIDYLSARGWLVERMIGNAFQKGVPDLYAHHPKWQERWIDVKRPGGAYSFTKAQRLKWPTWEQFGVGIWILTGACQEQYDLLFGPPNWRDFWRDSWGDLPDIDSMLDSIE